MRRLCDGVDEGYRGTNQCQRASKVRLDRALSLQIETRHCLPEKVILSDELYEGVLKLRLAGRFALAICWFGHFLSFKLNN